MNDDFNDRLLEESLKQYSRVSPPEGFEVRLPVASPGLSRWWLLVPAAAALATMLLLLPRPAPAPPSPQTKLPTAAGIPQVIRVRNPHSAIETLPRSHGSGTGPTGPFRGLVRATGRETPEGSGST